MRVISALTVAAFLLAGCAGYCIEDESTGEEGYVVYEPWPHILRSATTSNAGRLTGYKFQVVYLPNRARPYRVKSWSGLGKADFKFDFQDGWMLTGIHDKGDNTKVLEALTGLIPDLPGPESADEPPEIAPVLYRMEFDDCGRICGLTPIQASEGAVACAQKPCPPRVSPPVPCAPPPPPPPPCASCGAAAK